MEEYKYEDDGFDGYEVTTVDPGNSFLIATTILCVLLYAILPCMVAFKRRKSRGDREGSLDRSKETEEESVNALEIADIIRNAPELQDNSGHRIDNDNISVASTKSRASSIMKAILDAAPHARHAGGTRRALEKRMLMLEKTEANSSVLDSTNDGNNSVGTTSILGKIDHDEISFHDAVDAADPAYEIRAQPKRESDDDWWKPTSFSNSFDMLLAIAEWDYETKRLWKLSFPFVFQALFAGICEVSRVALIGHFIGTDQLSAYVVVDLLIGLTTDCLGGLHESLTSLCSHAIGVGNRRLAGQYVQIVVILYVAFFIPIAIMWIFIIDDAMKWLGFEGETPQMGQDFTKIVIWHKLIEGIGEAVDNLLDVTDHEYYSMAVDGIMELISVACVAIAVTVFDASLNTLGFIYIIVEFVGVTFSVIYISHMGWFRSFQDGLIGSFALSNGPAVKMVLRTSAALSAGYLLAYGEWEILTIFASFLGPAEVAAWGLLGTLWDLLEDITESMADASEVRCSFLLGSGKPAAAKLSAYKSTFLGFFLAIVLTSIVFICGEDLPRWLTKDATLQRLVGDLIPLFGIGNIALTIGTMAWTLVGSQGRYRLATALGFAGSWLVTTPLAAIFSIALNIDLQGQTAAVVIGYMISGTVTTYVLLTSDWSKLSKKLIEFNTENHIYLSDDESSSSSSSESSTGSNTTSGPQANSSTGPTEAVS